MRLLHPLLVMALAVVLIRIVMGRRIVRGQWKEDARTAMNLRAYTHWVLGPVVVVFGGIATVGCHDTWQGVKDDTRNAVHKTGEGVEKVGEKLEGADRKAPSTPPATDAGP